MYENLRKNRMQRSVDGTSYSDIRNQKDSYRKSKNFKVNFAAIEKMTYNDLNTGKPEDDFKPQDILDDFESNSEDEILKKFKKDTPPV